MAPESKFRLSAWRLDRFDIANAALVLLADGVLGTWPCAAEKILPLSPFCISLSVRLYKRYLVLPVRGECQVPAGNATWIVTRWRLTNIGTSCARCYVGERVHGLGVGQLPRNTGIGPQVDVERWLTNTTHSVCRNIKAALIGTKVETSSPSGSIAVCSIESDVLKRLLSIHHSF